MVYRFLKLVISIGIHLFYRQIKVKGRRHLDTKGPKIIIANHPNTLMDAWLLGYVSKEPIYYMAKGTFFNTRFKKMVLKHLGLIPINRATESKTKGVSNQDSFEDCYQLLERGKTLVIFPEGTSFMERQLRELKSGAARIALQVEHRNKGAIGVEIVPVGLVYTRGEQFRSAVLINIGDSISVRPYLNEYETNASSAAKKLTQEFSVRLSELLVGAHSIENEKLVEDIVAILASNYMPSKQKGVEKDVSLMRTTFEQINRLQETDPKELERIRELVVRIRIQLQQLEIKSDFLDRNYRPRMFFRQLLMSLFFLLVGLPITIFGVFHNIIPYLLTDLIIRKKVKEIEYHAPLTVLIGLVLYPLNYLGMLALLSLVGLFEWTWYVKIIYVIAMPLTGLFAWGFYKYIGHISFKTNFIMVMQTQKNNVQRVKEQREELRIKVFGPRIPD